MSAPRALPSAVLGRCCAGHAAAVAPPAKPALLPLALFEPGPEGPEGRRASENQAQVGARRVVPAFGAQPAASQGL
jgi:hypothetical protein